jgi:hypothetical protein
MRAGETATRRLAEGFTVALIASDLAYLNQVSRTRLESARA